MKIDAEKLIAEIERQQRKLIILSSITEQVDMIRGCALQNAVYNSILIFINSLQQEQSNVDLEKEIVLEWKKCKPTDEGMGLESANIVNEQFDAIARHFYKLGFNARKI